MNTVVQEPVYFPFALSPLWDHHRNIYQAAGYGAWSRAEVPEWSTTNPYLANSFAHIALGFWRDAHKRNSEYQQTFYIIELGAGSGRFARHFLQIFLPMFDTLATSSSRVCYVMSDFCAATVRAWQDNPKLQPFVQQGRLDFAVFDAESDMRFDLLESGTALAPQELACPPVIIANGVFSCLRQDLFFIEHKKIYEGWLKLESESAGELPQKDSPFQYTLRYQKRPLQHSGYTNTEHMQWLRDYAQSLPTCALLFPFKALALLENLRNLHGRNMLLLSADRGLLNKADIAAHGEPEWQVNDGLAFPVNYHAIANAFAAAGGQVWNATPRTPEQLGLVAAIYGAGAEWPETRLAVQQTLQTFNTLDFYAVRKRLREDAEYFSPTEMLAWLRLSQWDTRMFYDLLPHLTLGGLPKHQQDDWCEALTRIWQMHLPIGEDYDLAFDLASTAGTMHRWGLTLQLLNESICTKGEQPESLCNVGIAYWQLAEHEKAEKYFQQALKRWREEQASWDQSMEKKNHPEDDEEDPIEEHLLTLQEWQIHCRNRVGADRLTQSVGGIYLSLLGLHHAEALYRHQRNRLLAQQVGVQKLENLKRARDWIARENTLMKTPFAILHPQFGLIGLATMTTTLDKAKPQSRCADFYYWIAPDFQSQGFGSQALGLLQTYAAGLAVDHLFARVHEDNKPSRRALEKAGFAQLQFPVDAFAEDEAALVYFHKALRQAFAGDPQCAYQAFSDYINAFDVPLQLAPYAARLEPA